MRDAADLEDVQQLIEGTLGEGTYIQKTFRYHVDRFVLHNWAKPLRHRLGATLKGIAPFRFATVRRVFVS